MRAWADDTLMVVYSCSRLDPTGHVCVYACEQHTCIYIYIYMLGRYVLLCTLKISLFMCVYMYTLFGQYCIFRILNIK